MENEAMETLAKEILASKDPAKVLKKAAPKGKFALPLWELAAAGLLPVADKTWLEAYGSNDLRSLLADAAASVDPALLMATFADFDSSYITQRDLISCVKASYEAKKNAAAWDAQFHSLPPFLQGAVAVSRIDAEKDVPLEVRERFLEVLARACLEGESNISYIARDMGEEGEPWSRRIARHVEVVGVDHVSARVSEYLDVAPWTIVRAFLQRFPNPNDSHIVEVIQKRGDPALEVFDIVENAGFASDSTFLKVVVTLATRQGVVLPGTLDEHLVSGLADGLDDPDFLRGLGALPTERLLAMFETLRAQDEPAAFELWRHLDDPAIADTLETLLRDAATKSDDDSTFSALLAAGTSSGNGVAVFEKLMREEDGSDSASVQRIFDYRGAILTACASVDGPPPLEAVLPGDELRFASSYSHNALRSDDFKVLFARLAAPDAERVRDAWIAADWHGHLEAYDFFGVTREDEHVQQMPWEAIMTAAATTSITHLEDPTISNMGEHGAPIEAKLELFDALLTRADLTPHRGDRNVISACVSIAARSGSDAAGPFLQRAILALVEHDGLASWIADEHIVARDRVWVGSLVAALDKGGEHAQGAAERFRAKMETVAEIPVPQVTEDPVERIRRLAVASGRELDLRIYALVERDDEDKNTTLRLASEPLGLSEEEWPHCGDTRMEHVITFDLRVMPEMRARAGYDDEVAGLAVFISNRAENEAFTSGSGETAVIPLTAAQLDRGHSDDGRSYAAVALDVPAGTFDDDALSDLKGAVRRLKGRVLGSPSWIQEGEGDDASFLAQMCDDLVPGLNCGGGDLFVFADDAHWQC